jgi:hypothetical protein
VNAKEFIQYRSGQVLAEEQEQEQEQGQEQRHLQGQVEGGGSTLTCAFALIVRLNGPRCLMMDGGR